MVAGRVSCFCLLTLLQPSALWPAPPGGRITLSLDGEWQIADSVSADEIPKSFGHRGPAPGLANLAEPRFVDVDRYDSRDFIESLSKYKIVPESAIPAAPGVARQDRNYFWYRRTFRPPARKQVAVLTIAKAQFASKVWLNRQVVGEHLSCFTSGIYDVTRAIRWDGENELIVRIGAHPGAMPPQLAVATDGEKAAWTPGIYDSVSLALSDNPVIESVQVAPRIASSSIVVQTVIRNFGPAVAATLRHTIRTANGGQQMAATAAETIRLAAGESRTVTQTIRIRNARLWSPEDPFLYRLDSSTGGDSASARFGMREFRFDTATRRAYLNGKVIFLRGSNITLHRFFEDPECRNLPWSEAWVRKLLIDIPKKMHWNSLRFCVGPVPARWLDIADEAGLLIQNEYPIWNGRKDWSTVFPQMDLRMMTAEFAAWMRDNWNHPSLVIWDASNEAVARSLAEQIIPEVRKLDLSGRPWENGYNLPSGPDDPTEDHNYMYLYGHGKLPTFKMADLERMTSARGFISAWPTAHATILNEYGWLWLNRDGSPTILTKELWNALAGPRSTAEERFEMNAYLLAGLTEYFRAHRTYAGVLHFVYLGASHPRTFTSDHFRNVAKLELDPHFLNRVGEAFKPLGVYINFFQPRLEAGSERRIAVMMVNDEPRPVAGKLALSLSTPGGEALARMERTFSLGASGAQTVEFLLSVPRRAGQCRLEAAAAAAGPGPARTTVSRRNVEISETK